MRSEDVKQLTTHVNGAYEGITGRSAASILRHPSSYAEIIHPVDRATVLAKLEDAVHTGNFEEEFRITRPDGEVRWVGVSASPVRRGDEIVRLAGSVQDITARKIADGQIALHLAEAKTARKQADDARAEAEALHKAALTLIQDQRMDAVLDTLLQTLLQIVPYDAASVILTEGESRERLFVVREAPPQPAGRTVVTLETSENQLLQRVLFLKKTVRLADTREEIDWRENKALGNVRTWIAVPLVVSDNVLGLLSIAKAEPRAFTPGEILSHPRCRCHSQRTALRVGSDLRDGTANLVEKNRRGPQVRRKPSPASWPTIYELSFVGRTNCCRSRSWNEKFLQLFGDERDSAARDFLPLF